jgi:DNA-binding transcriptional LysR family regulator
VAFDHDLPIRRAIDRALKQHGVKVDVAMEFDNVETIKQAIGIAAGISILPAPTVQKESEMRTLAAVELALPGLVRPVAIIHRRGRHLTAAVSRFIAQLRDDDARSSVVA